MPAPGWLPIWMETRKKKMADDADRSDERIGRAVAAGIEAARLARSLPAVGRRYNCDDDVPVGYLFCCGECRADWELREKMRGITGK